LGYFDVSCIIYKKCIETTVLNSKLSLLRLLFKIYMSKRNWQKVYLKELYVEKVRELRMVYAVHLAVIMFVQYRKRKCYFL